MANAGSEQRQRISAANCFCQFPQSPEWQTNWFDLPPILLQGIPERLNVLPPANKFVGSAGKLGSGARRPPKAQKVKVVKLTFLIFVTLGGCTVGGMSTRPYAQSGRSYLVVLLLVVGVEG